MKIKMFIPIALILCLVFSLCACGTITNTPATTAANTETATAPVETTAPVATTVPAETTAPAEFTEEDALELVKNTYDPGSDCFYHVKGTVEVDGVNYYAVDLRRSFEDHSSYLETYFVTTDGAEIVRGYFVGGEPVLNQKEAADFTEEDALELVKNTYEPGSDCFYHVRGTVEVDGVSYYGVDVMKSLEDHVTYMSLTYFVNTDGSDIVKGYYVGNEAIFTTGDEKPSFTINEENAVKYVNATYDFGDNEFLVLKGIEEIDGVNYYAVDLRRSFEDHSSYLSTYFVNEDGTEILTGYYDAGVAVITE